jgi:hypothetical protein
MDSIGLLAAWIGVLTLLFVTPLSVIISLVLPGLLRLSAKRRMSSAGKEHPDSAISVSDLAELVSLYGSAILNLVGASATVILSILLLDLGPSLLAAMLPFHIDAKMLTRFTGLFLLIISYFFAFRLSYLAVKIRLANLARKPLHHSERAASAAEQIPGHTRTVAVPEV